MQKTIIHSEAEETCRPLTFFLLKGNDINLRKEAKDTNDAGDFRPPFNVVEKPTFYSKPHGFVFSC